MKKISLVVIAFLLCAGTAYASSNVVGKKVDSVISVYKDGQKLNTEAVVINGVTYAPVRAVSEAVGVDVKYEGGKVTLSTSTANTSKIEEAITRKDDTIEATKKLIQTLNESITTLNGNLEEARKNYVEKPNTTFEDSHAYKVIMGDINTTQELLDKTQAELTKLQQEKAQLTAQLNK